MSALTPEEIENLDRFRHTFSMELEQAQDMINHGHILPLDSSLHASIKNIQNTLAEAKNEGAEISPDALMITCADEAKRIFQKQLSNYARTLFGNRHRGQPSEAAPLPHHPACGSAPGGSRS